MHIESTDLPRISLTLLWSLAYIGAFTLARGHSIPTAQASDAARHAGRTTPLLLGTRGSRLDLVIDGAYFTGDLPEPTTMAASDAVWEWDLRILVPLYTAFTSGDARIVGTTLDYFDLRDLTLSDGRPFALLGRRCWARLRRLR